MAAGRRQQRSTRIGRSREPTMSDHRPRRCGRPHPAPGRRSPWRPPTPPTSRGRVISHTSVNVHTTTCGTTSSTETAWMRHSTADPRYGLARSSLGGLGARRPRRVDHRHRAHDGRHRAHQRRETTAPPRRRGFRPAAESPTRPTQLPTAARSGGCPSPARAAPAGTSRPPGGRWPNCCSPRPFRRAAGTRRRRPGSRTDAAANAAAAVSAEPSASTIRSPTRSTT